MVDTNRPIGSKAVLRVARGSVADVSAATDIAQPDWGLANYQVTASRQPTTVGGSGDYVSQQSTPSRTSSVAFTLPQHPGSDELFGGKSLRRFTVRMSPYGETAGERWQQYEAIGQVVETAPVSAGPVTMAVTLAIDGDIAEGVH